MSYKPAAPAQRIGSLDLLRGLTVCSMIAYHICWDLVHLFAVPWDWFYGTVSFVWQQSICWVFILLSGFCWGMSRHGIRRGLTISAAGLLVSVVTYATEPEEPVFFGVLTLLGVAMLLLTPVRTALLRVPRVCGLAVCMVVFVLFRNAKDGFFGFGTWNLCAVPSVLYRNAFTACLGFPPSGFYSSDYFPIFPWLFLFAAGFFLYRCWNARGRPLHDVLPVRTPLHAIGRHSLLIYLVHQPLIMGMLTLCARSGLL